MNCVQANKLSRLLGLATMDSRTYQNETQPATTQPELESMQARDRLFCLFCSGSAAEDRFRHVHCKQVWCRSPLRTHMINFAADANHWLEIRFHLRQLDDD